MPKRKHGRRPPAPLPLTIADLKPDPHNRRAHPERNLDMMADALRTVGAARSIVLNEQNEILAGNGIVQAAAAAGITRVQLVEADGQTIVAVRRSGLTADEQRRLAMYDNRTGELATWDAAQLAADLQDGADLTPFFLDAELEALIPGGSGAPAHGGHTDPDDLPAPRPTDIQRGDLFTLGRHRILCGDGNQPDDVRRLLAGDDPDLLLTDPPYCSGGFQEAGKISGSIGTRSDEMIHNDTLSTRGYMALLRSVIGHVNARAAYVFTDWRMWITLFDVLESCGYGVRNMIVWDKQTPGMGQGWRHQHELVMFAKSSRAAAFDPHVAQGNVIQCTRTGNVLHPTQKPTELIEKILRVTTWAPIVVDPFLGSGTTLIACEAVGRDCRALELAPQFCQITIDRWEAHTGQQAVKEDA
jgi:DNA modification methylase